MLDILPTMAGNLFDVFVVGSTDPSAAGETRLAAALSAKHGVPLATVAKAISAKNLRAGQSLERVQAQALVRQLQSIGAVTVIRTAGAGSRAAVQSPNPQLGDGSPRWPTVARATFDDAHVGANQDGHAVAWQRVARRARASRSDTFTCGLSTSRHEQQWICHPGDHAHAVHGIKFTPLSSASSPKPAAPNQSGARNPFEPRPSPRLLSAPRLGLARAERRRHQAKRRPVLPTGSTLPPDRGWNLREAIAVVPTTSFLQCATGRPHRRRPCVRCPSGPARAWPWTRIRRTSTWSAAFSTDSTTTRPGFWMSQMPFASA